MPDMQDIQLNLIVSAENQTGEAFGAVRSTLDSMSNAIKVTFEEIDASSRQLVAQVADNFRALQTASQTFTQGMGNSFRDARNIIDAEFTVISEDVSRDLEGIPLIAGEVAQKTESEFSKAAQEIKQIFKEISDNVKTSFKSLADEKGIFGIQGQMDTMYAGMAMGAAAMPIVGMLKESVQAFAEFDHEMRLVNQEMNLSEGQFKGLEQQVMNLSNSTGIASSELAKGLYNIVATGVTNTSDALTRLKVAAEGAKAGNTDLDTTTKALNEVMGAFGMKADQAQHVMDVMFTAVNNGQMHFVDLARSVGASATAAAQAGISYEELAAAQATLTNVGKNAEAASQNLNSLIIGIIAPTKQAQQEAKNLGIEWDAAALKAKGLSGMIDEAMKATHGNADELKKLLPNQRAYLTVLALGGKAHEQYISTLNKMKNANGATAQALQQVNKSAQESIDKMKTSLQNAGMQVAAALAPAITKIAEDISKLAQWFQHLSPATKQMISYALLGAGAFLTLGSAMFMSISAVGSVVTGVKRIREAFTGAKTAMEGLKVGESILPRLGRSLGTVLTSGLRSLGGAISNLIFGPWKLLINGFRSLPGAIMRIPSLFSGLVSGIARFGTGILGAFRAIPGGIRTLISGVTGGIRLFLTSITRIGPAIMNIIRFFFNWRNALMLLRNGFMLIRGAMALVTGPWGALVLLIVAGVSYVISHWNQITKWVQQNFGKTIPTNFKQFQQLASQVWNQVVRIFTEVWNAIKKAVLDAWNYIRPTLVDGIKEVQKYWNQVWPQIQELFTEVWNIMKAILGPAVASMYITISAALGFISGAWKDAWNLCKDTLKFIWDEIVGVIKTAWDLISGLFKVALDILTGHWDKAWNDMVQTISNVWNDITSTFDKLVSDAWSWGENLLKMLADGISSGITWVENAVSNVAKKIASYLGFHSPTEEGPASDSDKWSPNFMKMYAQGIEDHQYLVETAVRHTAQVLKKGLSPSVKAKIYHEQQHLIPMLRPLLATPVKPIIERDDPFLEADTKTYDWVSGHTSHHPTTSYYDFLPGHTSHHHTVININIEGRSYKTDRELAEHMAAVITRHIKTHR